MGKTVKLGDVVVDTEKGTAVKNSRDLFLSALEYRLLLFFIKRLREKIEDDPTDPKIILTVRGTGYKVDA